LLIKDEFEGAGLHDVLIPVHLAPGISIAQLSDCELMLSTPQKRFSIWWPKSSGYMFRVEDARVSPSYGVLKPIKKLTWFRHSASLKPLILVIAPTKDRLDAELRLQLRLSQAQELCGE